MHYFDRILELQAICLSSMPDDWRPAIADYAAKLAPEDLAALISCMEREVRRETKLLAAKKAALTILKTPGKQHGRRQ